jgi:hypothetical protein
MRRRDKALEGSFMKSASSRFIPGLPSALLAALAVVAIGSSPLPAVPGQAQIGGAASNPLKVAGPEKCGECHKSEFAAWQKTHHANTFLEMHRKPDAAEIVKKLGGKRIKQNEHCLQCHYTQGLKESEPAALWGVTCESCHGQAKEWIDVHNDYGGKGSKKETETADHKKLRLEKTAAAGMIRPADTYQTAANCYSCHTVPDEELVNKGGHKPRSDFDLVAWSQGEVRHNYFYSADKKNREASPAHKLVLYVTGKGLDLEYSLRAAAKATTAGPFVDNAARSAASAVAKLKEVQAAQAIPEVAEMIAAGSGASVKPGNGVALNKAADAVAAANQKFGKGNDGSKLSALGKLVPPAGSSKGTAQP